MTRRPRLLSRDERFLWDWATRDVPPLNIRAAKKTAEPPISPAALKQAAAKQSSANPPQTPAKLEIRTRAAPRAPAPLGRIEAPVLRRLRRGQAQAEAVLDLHGMRQMQAHQALIRFIERCHREDTRLALVITGKGGRPVDESGGREESGVIRRMVPHWLSESHLRALIVGFEAAALRHGGAGAIYVRIRRARGAA